MERFWYKNYDPGVPHTVDADQYTSLVHVMEECFSRYADRPCFRNYGVTMSFQKLNDLSCAFAGYLQNELKLQKGDRIALMMPSLLQYPVAVFGALRAGLLIVNVNPLFTYKELNYLLKETSPKCILIFENFAYLLEAAVLNTEVKYIIYTQWGDLFPWIKRKIVNVKMRKKVSKWHIPGAIAFRKTIHLNYKKRFKEVEIDRNDVAFLQLTSGRQTGWEKCVMLTHRNFIANMLQCSYWLESFFMQPQKFLTFNPFPFSKTFCMTISFFMLRVGLGITLITNPRDVPGMVRALKRSPFCLFFGTNSLLDSLMRNEEFSRMNFSELKFTFCAGSAVQRAVAEKWQVLTHCPVQQVYGLVEASPVVSITPFSLKKFTGNVGLPVPSTDIKICDENEAELPIDSIGELWIKGPQVMKGYWNCPEKTKEVLTEEGWLRTGDMAFVDAGGFIHIVDRKEDMMVIAGNKVFAIEIEEVIAAIDGIYEVAVIAIPTEKGEFFLKAAVVRSNPNLVEEDILKVCKKKLKPFQIPKIVEFYPALPRSIVGYVLRRVLREEYLINKKPWSNEIK